MIAHLVSVRSLCLFLFAFLATSQVVAQPALSPLAGEFDNGKMWTFDTPPYDYFSETYNFDANADWFEEARLGTLRIPGCTASFVSSTGLMLTNHHCGRGHVADVSEPGEQLLDEGFYATSLSEERQAPNLYADQLIAIEDVTAEVQAAEALGQTDAERSQFRADTIAAIVQREIDERPNPTDADIHVEVVTLYHGGQYAAYIFKRYQDVRLVMAPELKLGYFGGDADNFTYPRYTFDITLFRVYGDDGEPLESEHFFQWSLEGAHTGDAVFAVGNPGSTSRLETTAQLKLRRDVTDKTTDAFVKTRLKALEAYLPDASRDEADGIRNQIFSLRNAEKLYTGKMKALNDQTIMGRRLDAERRFLMELRGDEALGEQYGHLMDEMTEAVNEKLELGDSYSAFFALTSGAYSSALMRRALTAYSVLQAPDLTYYPASAIGQLTNVADQPVGLMVEFLAARIRDMQTAAEAGVQGIDASALAGDAKMMAQELVESSVLASSEGLAGVIERGELNADDPAIQFVGSFFQAYQTYQSAWSGLSARQSTIAAELGRARFAVYSTDIPPDATFSLRIADGVVEGYEYNGTFASPFTNFFGLYDHFYSYGEGSEWDLPERWIRPPIEFHRDVPLNFASTNDIIGGNSGSPVINTDLELVGVIFDGNIESLAGDYIYLPDIMRAVSVDARGILEALDKIYDADRLVLELTEDELVATEAEADERLSAAGD